MATETTELAPEEVPTESTEMHANRARDKHKNLHGKEHHQAMTEDRAERIELREKNREARRKLHDEYIKALNALKE